MEFWGVEVEAGKPLKIKPDLHKYIHVSQVALGEVKDVKGALSVPVHLKIDDKDYVIGTLSAEVRPQLMLDLVFEKEFELSHDWKKGSVYFAGYTEIDGYPSDEDCPCGEDGVHEHGIPDKAKVKQNGGNDSDDAGDSDSSEEESSTDISLEDGSQASSMDDSDFSDEDYSSDDTPSMDKLIGKRLSESIAEVPVPAKKAKLSTPEKTGGKKGQAGKAPPSAGNRSSNNKSFSSETRKKGKHGGK